MMIVLLSVLLLMIILTRVNLKKLSKLNRQQCTIDVEIMLPLKYPCNFWRTLEMPRINFGK